MAEDEKPRQLVTPLEELEARLAKNPRAQRIVASILADLNPPKKWEGAVREAILRELETHGALRRC
ncbi:hypothetical protein [Methylocystis echinoides]|jgi:hypothetical protein|uniref:hypothetical protein n=1 Tax=Methylocystis echinoides TaxID=29468 RepID=UPI00341E02B1